MEGSKEKKHLNGKENKRENIMNCAIDLFYAKGFDAVGVQEIVDKAGITKPTLYYYFGSKIGLLEAILQEKVKPLIQVMWDASRGEKSIEDVLCDTALAFVGCCKQNMHIYHLFMALLFSAKENEAYQKAIPLIAELYGMVENIFDEKRELLGNMRGRQTQFAVGFIGILNNFMLWRFALCGNEYSYVEDYEVREIVKQYMYGIFS